LRCFILVVALLLDPIAVLLLLAAASAQGAGIMPCIDGMLAYPGLAVR
jgi:hypothetical protein